MPAPGQSDPALSLTAGILVQRLRADMHRAHRTTGEGPLKGMRPVELTEETLLAMIRWIEAGAPRDPL